MQIRKEDGLLLAGRGRFTFLIGVQNLSLNLRAYTAAVESNGTSEINVKDTAESTTVMPVAAFSRVTLLKNLAAIHVFHTEDGMQHSSAILQLPKGAELYVCGPGFNLRTAKVEFRGEFYFVFLQDIQRSERQDEVA